MLALHKLKVEALKKPLLRQIGMTHRKQTQYSHKSKSQRLVGRMSPVKTPLWLRPSNPECKPFLSLPTQGLAKLLSQGPCLAATKRCCPARP